MRWNESNNSGDRKKPKNQNKPCSALRFRILSRGTSLVQPTLSLSFLPAVVLLLVSFKVASVCLCTAPHISSCSKIKVPHLTLTSSNTPSRSPAAALISALKLNCVDATELLLLLLMFPQTTWRPSWRSQTGSRLAR